MDKKKQTEKELQEEIRLNLENLLGDDPVPNSTVPATSANASQPVSIIDTGTDLGARLAHPNTQPTDFHQKKKAAATDARRTLKSLIDFYLGAKIIKKNDYVKFKKKVDEMSLANMMFAIEASQVAIIKLLEEIDMGNTHPRNFEAMATLNGQMMNMIKVQQSLFVTMEEGYKKIKHDHDIIEAEGRTEDADAQDVKILDGSFKTRGTKMLMANLQKTIKEEKAKKAGDTDEDEAPRLTSVTNRPKNTIHNAPDNKKNEKDESDEIYDGLDEHF